LLSAAIRVLDNSPQLKGRLTEIFGDNVTMAVHRAWDRYGNVTVHTKFDGTYDKTNLPDPLILTQYFTMQGGLITQLIILRNKTPA
jgi:hypothetical protein